jgi:formylglycine-generating enzyme required for sulfatase activity
MSGEQGNMPVKTTDLEQSAASYLKSIPGTNDINALIKQFFEYYRLRGGLLDVEGKYTSFAQMPFQEFLVGQYLDESNPDPESIVTFLEQEGRIGHPWWYEPTIHAIALVHSTNEKRTERFIELLAHLGDSSLPENTVYLAELRAVGEACIEHRFTQNLSKRIAARISERLFDPESVKSVPLTQCADLGRILGIIGDPRSDVTNKIPTMIKIEQGSFLMGHPIGNSLIDLPSLQSGQYEVNLDDYWISKYPITNAQFEHFISAGGYSSNARRFWTEAGWEWKSRWNIFSPAYWSEIEWRIENHPVIGISWFEAVAYCKWLSEVTGQKFRLPTEAEWEKAAAGKGPWPWGSDFDDEPSNTSESGIGKPTCVGLFVGSASLSGIHDMAGNVWQWCNSEFRTYDKYQPTDGRESIDGSSPRCIRGGSWLNNKDRARLANRDHYFPGDRHYDLGFRVVESR